MEKQHQDQNQGWVNPPPYTQDGMTTQQPQRIVHVVQQNILYGPNPVQVTCPNCSASITSATTEETGVIAWVMAGGLCLVGCWLGCCLIPLCVDSLKDVTHTCPNCQAFLGRYKAKM